MARRLAWSDVRGGLVALLVLIALSVAILKYARVGALHGDRIRLYARAGAARGIMKGSEVWLLGQKVGLVTDVRFQSPSESDTTSRLLIAMEVQEKYTDAIRRDAVAQIRPGGSMIGAVVVYLSPGSAATPAIRDGDTIRTSPQADIEGATARFGAAGKELPAILGNVRALRAELQATQGTAGALLHEETAATAQLKTTAAQLARLRVRVGQARGSVSRLMDGTLGARMSLVLARVDSVRTLLASPDGSLGRFRKDSTLVTDLADIQKQLARVNASLTESQGTAGRVLHDSAVFSAVGDVQREIGLLIADMKKHPLRYNPF
jgi:phospholipid/cholesterol/gamma-HCH transport system substrate-binding protein